MELNWTCDRCGGRIEKKQGWIIVYGDELRTAIASHEESRRIVEAHEGRAMLVSDVPIPKKARWHVLHSRCDRRRDMPGDYAIHIERVATYADLLEWTAHLWEKTWIDTTSWPSLIRRFASSGC